MELLNMLINRKRLKLDYINYNGNNYLCRWLDLGNEWGTVLISISSLDNVIMNNANYSSKEAQRIDEQIFFYVDDAEIFLPQNILIHKILEVL